MTGYVSQEMFPQQIVLENKQVELLYKTACQRFRYAVYCCYSPRISEEGTITFIHIHDNDGSEAKICTGPFIVKWVASLSGEFNKVDFLPYLACTRMQEDEVDYLIGCLSKSLESIGITLISKTIDDWIQVPNYQYMRGVDAF